MAMEDVASNMAGPDIKTAIVTGVTCSTILGIQTKLTLAKNATSLSSPCATTISSSTKMIRARHV